MNRLTVFAALICGACRGHAPAEAAGSAGGTGHGSGSAAHGAARWIQVIGGPGDDDVNGLALTGDGVVVVGAHDGEIGGLGTKLGALGAEDAFVVGLGRDGHVRWARSLGSPEPDFAWSVAPTTHGVVVGIETDGTLEVDGARSRDPKQEQRGAQPPVLAAFDDKGKLAWMRALPGDNGAVRAVAAKGDDVAVGGWSLARDGARDFGLGPMKCDLSAMFVGVWNSGAKARWVVCSKAKQAAPKQVPAAVAIGPDGHVAVCARIGEGRISFGEQTVQNAADRDAMVVAEFDQDGKPLWVVQPRTADEADCRGVAISESGLVVVAADVGLVRPTGTVIALDNGKTAWTASVPQVSGLARGVAGAIGTFKGEVLLGVRSASQGALVRLDGKQGKALGAPLALGNVEPIGVAATDDTVYLAADFEGDVSVLGQTVKGHGKKDVVVVAMPR